ncbi:MAG TPA: peptidylprolyl isomerase [Deltaproteobacteria bacterium]|nr:peptidylprolyl isomerase [Deltaproteobacteria bacterium]HQB38236.1 peptidylprolyl isomerase [Deltaproteobacteria bacterium]
MAKVKDGDKVQIHYIGKLEDGSVFDSTYESHDCGSDDECGCEETGPMEFTIGAEEFFPQVDRALIGMEPGEKKSVVVPAMDAFGEYDEEKVFTVGRDEMPEDMKPEVGDELTITNDDDDSFDVTVVAVAEDSVTFDGNHPLAGEDLTFEIELVEIR